MKRLAIETITKPMKLRGISEVIDISFFALIVGDGAGCFINGIYILVAVLV